MKTFIFCEGLGCPAFFFTTGDSSNMALLPGDIYWQVKKSVVIHPDHNTF